MDRLGDLKRWLGIGLAGCLLAYGSWWILKGPLARRGLHREALEAAAAPCIERLGGEVAFAERLQRYGEPCFEFAFSPERPGSLMRGVRVSPGLPARVDHAAFQDCLVETPEVVEARGAEQRRRAADEHREQRRVLDP